MNEYFRWRYGIRTVERINEWMNIANKYMVYEQLNKWINKWMNITDEDMVYEQLNELINE